MQDAITGLCKRTVEECDKATKKWLEFLFLFILYGYLFKLFMELLNISVIFVTSLAHHFVHVEYGGSNLVFENTCF